MLGTAANGGPAELAVLGDQRGGESSAVAGSGSTQADCGSAALGGCACCSRYSPGWTPFHFLKARWNALVSWKPTRAAMSATLIVLLHSRSMARSRRNWSF